MGERRFTVRLVRDENDGKCEMQLLGATAMNSFEATPENRVFRGANAEDVCSQLGQAIDEQDAPKAP